MKKVLSIILSIMLLLSMTVISVSADEYDFTTTDDYFDLLQLYIETYGEYDEDGYKTVSIIEEYESEDGTPIVHGFIIQNKNGGIYFDSASIYLYNEYVGMVLYANFTLYKTTNIIPIYFAAAYIDQLNEYGDAVEGTQNIDRTTYDQNSVYPFNYSGIIFTEEISTNFFNNYINLIFSCWDLYFSEEYGFDLGYLGFREYPEATVDAACDLATQYHIGYEDIRNELEATCTANGYTGDVYCTHCGNTVSIGNEIPAYDHSYDDSCDSQCNNCGFFRNASHSFENNICTNCGSKAYKSGDINDDATVDTSDLALMKLHLAGARTLDETGELAGDIDANGEVDTSDLALLKLHLAGARPIV